MSFKKIFSSVIRLIRFLVGVCLIPACLGMTLVLVETVRKNIHAQSLFWSGFAISCLLLFVFRAPLKTYVVGHELTHVVWVWLFRGRVKKLSFSGNHGSVVADKSNLLIRIAPYFFPFYAALVTGIYYGLGVFWNVRPYFPYFLFISGFTWGFHVILTVVALTEGQDEIRRSGRFFSLAAIYLLNLLILGFFMVLVYQEVRITNLYRDIYGTVKQVYMWVCTAIQGYLS